MLYAIDLLDAMDKRHLVTPLLLAHESPEIRARALRVAEAAGRRWPIAGCRASSARSKIRTAAVRIAAVSALAVASRPGRRRRDAAVPDQAAIRRWPSSPPRRWRAARSADDVDAAEETLRHFSSDTREQGAEWRLQVARALGDVKNPAFRPLLVPLMYDTNLDVARAAIESAGTLGAGDFLFVPPLVSLLRNRRLKSAGPRGAGRLRRAGDRAARLLHARSRGRHLGPPPRALDAGAAALPGVDGRADHRARRQRRVPALQGDDGAASACVATHPELTIDPKVVSRHINAEAARAFNALTLHYNLFVAGGLDKGSLLARTLTEKHARALTAPSTCSA